MWDNSLVYCKDNYFLYTFSSDTNLAEVLVWLSIPKGGSLYPSIVEEEAEIGTKRDTTCLETAGGEWE